MTYQGLNHIVKSSVLASIKRDLRYGNRDSFNNLPDNLKLELVRSYRDFKFKKSVVKAHGLSASDDILSSTVTLVDYLGLSMHNVKAYSMLDFDDLDRAVKDEVESKFPHILGSIEKRISQIDSEITKEGSDLAEKAKTLFRKGWSLVEDRIKELDNNIVGYEKEISKLGEGNPHTKELLDQIESDQAKIKELEDSMDRRRSPGWPIEKDDKIGTLLDTVQELESEVLEIDLEMESLDQKVTSYTVAILKKREELYMGDWEFDQIFLDVLGISPDAELAQNTGTESGEEVKEEDKFTETEHLYEDDEIIQKKSALEDYGSGGMEKMILQRHELLEKINSLIKMREVKEVELNSFEKELQHLYLEREKVRRGLYKHFKLQYGDSRPAVLALELDVLEDRYEWAQKLFDSGRMVGVNSKALASGVFGSNYGSMAEDSKFIFSQLLEHSFFNLPFPKFDRQDVTLTHPDWEGEKLNLTMKSLRLFKDLQAMPDVLRVSYEIIRNKKGSEAVYVNLLTLFRNLFDKKTGDKTLLDLAEQDGLDELMEEFKGDFIYGEGEFSGQLETFNRVKDSFYSSTFKDLESRHPKDTMEGELVSFVAKHISNMMWHDFLRTLKEVNTDLSKVLNIDDSSITEEDGAQTYVGAIELNHPFFEKADLQVTLSQKLATILRNHQEEGLSIQDFKEEIFSLLEFKKVVQGYISRILSSVDLEDILEEYSGMEGIRYKDLFDPQKKKAVKEVFVMFLKALQNSSFNVSGTLDFEKYEGDVYRDKFPEDSFSKPKNIEQRRIKDPDKLLELELTMDD
ncbi:hypothetical protein HN499_00070, partial [archaeon]|nr:hypothetical protein [archaeon]